METYAMLAASLMSAAVGYVCGLIVGRDTRPVTTMIRQQWSETTSLLMDPVSGAPPPIMRAPENSHGPQVVRPASRGLHQGFSPMLASILQTPPDFNGPVYAIRIGESREWYYCTSAYEMCDGRLMSRSVYSGGREDYQYPVDPGQWVRVQ